MSADHIATLAPVGHAIPPQLLSHSTQRGYGTAPNVFRAGAGFDQLIARRGRKDCNGGVAADARSRNHCQAHALDTPLEVAVAKSTKQLEAADSLISKRYAWRGYKTEPSESGDEPEKRDDLSRNVTFFATQRGKVIGTLTLRLDGPAGLRADATHGDIIQYARSEGRRLGELTRLALAAHVDSRRVLSSLFGLVYSVGRWVHEVTDVFVEVNPRHVAFYVRALGFAIVGDAKFCERVCAPSILLYADVDSLEERLGLAVPSV